MRKRIFSFLTALAMCLTMLPAQVLGAEGEVPDTPPDTQAEANEPELLAEGTGDFTVEGGTLRTDYSYADGVLTILTGTPLTISGTTTADKIVIGAGVNADITFSDLSIQHSAVDTCAFMIPSAASATITLNGSNTLQSGENCAGLAVETGGTVTIKGDGALQSTGGKCGAGIGGGHTFNAGTIIIESGSVTAVGGFDGAGIGGGHSNDSQSNPYGLFDAIQITGGVIDARSPGNAAAIGTGCWAKTCPGSITIENAQVTAKTDGSHKRCAAIGRGISRDDNNYNCAVTIQNSIVSAQNVAGKGNSISGANGTPDIQNSAVKVNAGSERDNTYVVYGSYTLAEVWEIPADTYLFIDSGASLTIGSGATLTNSGTITNKGTLTINGTLQNDGTIKKAEDATITGDIQGNPSEIIQPVPYLTCDESGKTWTTEGCSKWTDVTPGLTTWNDGWYVVTGEVTISGHVNVDGDVHLILTDGCFLRVNGGIGVSRESSLTIYAQSEGDRMGRLTASVGHDGKAGLGSDGAVTICGGRVEATGGEFAAKSYAGITGSRITIHGGDITARARDLWQSSGTGAGIGGNAGGRYDGTITITGGTVHAVGGSISGNANEFVGAGIGCGAAGGNPTIIITGGTVTAQGGSSEHYAGNGIGGGDATLSTGENGNALIFAVCGTDRDGTEGEAIRNADQSSTSWNGVIFQGNEGQVYGSVTLTGDLTISSDKTLTIPENASLTVAEGVTFTNQGTVTNSGTISGGGTVVNHGEWSGSGTLTARVSASSVTVVKVTRDGKRVSTAQSGDNVTITATVTGQEDTSNRAVSGEVAFTGNGTALGTAPVVNGEASLEFTLDGSVGLYRIQAAYDGGAGQDSSYDLLSSSGGVNITVTSAQSGIEPTDVLCLNDGDIRIYRNEDGTVCVAQADANRELSGPLRITGRPGESTAHTVTVTGANADIVLSGVNQGSGDAWGQSPIIIESAYDGVRVPSNVTLTLEGENVLAGDGSCDCGIAVRSGSTLMIDGPGSLKIGNENTYVGVGIGEMERFGNVVINGGTLDITAQNVGIGAEWMMMHGEEVTPSIIINGGVVKTNVQSDWGGGVGIGTRDAWEGGMDITVNGGSVELSGNGNKISAVGDYPPMPEGSSSGSVTITGGSISAEAVLPTPTDGDGHELVPVTVSTGKSDAPVDDMVLAGSEYGSPAKTDGSGNLTLYLPKPKEETQYTGLAIVGGEVQTVTASASQDSTGTGSAAGTGVRVETPENTKPGIKEDGTIKLPGGSTIQTGEGPAITLPSGGTTDTTGAVTGDKVQIGNTTVTGEGTTVTPTGEVTVLTGGTVQTGEGPVITLPDGGTADKDGNVTVPDGGSVTQNGTTVTLTNGGTVSGDGSITVPEGGELTTTDKNGETVTITVPESGEQVQIDNEGNMTLPGGSTVQTGDGEPVQIPESGGSIAPGGEVTYSVTVTFDTQDGSEVESQTIPVGSVATQPENPTRSGYSFGGWFTDEDCTTAWSFDSAVTADMTLYAKWTVKYIGGGDIGGGSSSDKPAVTIGGDSEGGKAEASHDGTVTITPDKGYEVVKITVNGEEVEIPTDGKLAGLKRTDKVVVTFGKLPTHIPVSQRFVDVPAGAWYEEAVQFAVDNGLFYGTSDTTFSPNNNMTRGMLATVLYRLAKEPGASADHLFDDVADGMYYTEAIAWATENSIVAGYGNGLFGPDDPITREQLAVMLYRYAGKPAVPNLILPFSDANRASAYAMDALRWAVDAGILTGKGDGILDPTGKATRAEVAAMLMRYCEAFTE